MVAWLVVDITIYHNSSDEGGKLALRASLRGVLCIFCSVGVSGTLCFQKFSILSKSADAVYYFLTILLSSLYVIYFNHPSAGGIPSTTTNLAQERLSYIALLPMELLILIYASFATFKLSYSASQLLILVMCISYATLNSIEGGMVAPVVTFILAGFVLSIGARHEEISSRYEFRYSVHDQFQRDVINMMKSGDPDKDSKPGLQLIAWDPEQKLQDLMSQTFENDTMQSFIDTTLGGGRYKGNTSLRKKAQK